MNEISTRTLTKLVLVLALPVAAAAQATQPAGTLTIAGQPDQAAVVRINGKAYVDLESLARITHGSIKFQGNQTILTLPAAGTTPEPGPAGETPRPAQLSERFLSAEIEALAGIREWRVALVNAVENNYPVTDGWVGGLRRSAEAKVQLAVAATATEPDQRAAELLKNELANMQQMSDQFLALHAKDNYIAPNSFDNNALDQKILSCARGLASMAATKQFQDEATCH